MAGNRSTDQSSLFANSSTGGLHVPYQHLLLRAHSTRKLQSTPATPVLRQQPKGHGVLAGRVPRHRALQRELSARGHGRLRALLRSQSGPRGISSRGRGRAVARSRSQGGERRTERRHRRAGPRLQPPSPRCRSHPARGSPNGPRPPSPSRRQVTAPWPQTPRSPSATEQPRCPPVPRGRDPRAHRLRSALEAQPRQGRAL